MRESLLRYCLLATLLSLVSLVVAGCSPASKAGKSEAVDDSTIAVVRPSALFRGEMKRLEPHLDFVTSGCVEVEMKKAGWTVKPVLEVWNHGKGPKPIDVGHTSGEVQEVSMSLKDTKDSHDKRSLQVTVVEHTNDGHVAWRFVLDDPRPSFGMSGPKTLNQEIHIGNQEGVAVWGFVGGTGSEESRGQESIEEMAQRVIGRWY